VGVRFLRWALRFLALLFVLYLYFATLHPHQRISHHVFFDAPGPWAIAHRGGRGLWPENTLYAFEHARDLGVDLLEMDLRMTADGHIVVMHDRAVDATTNGRGLVSDMTLDELKELYAGARGDGDFPFRERGLRVPTLREVLTALSSSRLNLEMKAFTPKEATSLCRLLQEFDAEARVLVASFGQEPMLAFREECPSVATSATFREAFVFVVLHRVGLGSLYRSPAVAFQVTEYFRELHVVEPSFLESAKDANIQVQVWTINEPSDMKRLLDMGVHGILTDYPDRLLRHPAFANASARKRLMPLGLGLGGV